MSGAPKPVVPTSDPRLQALLAEYRAALAAGKSPSAEELLRGHPDIDPQVARAFASLAQPHETLTAAPPTPGNGATAGTLSAPLSVDGVFVPASGQFGDYELLEEVARGGMGVVFKARQKSLGRVVALKMILAGTLASAEQVRRFHLEAEEAGRLDHPNIVPIYQVGEHRGQHYFTMKLVEGGSLTRHLDAFRANPRASARLIATVALAVHHAHQRGILHRDLKPGNILLEAHGSEPLSFTPLVTDFGLAKHLGASDSETQSGAILGTPSYMAPEQAAARKDLSTAADVYALGAILYEMLTGRPPFKGGTAFETVVQVLECEPVPPRSLDGALDRDLETICLKCLNKDPAKRYGTAADLARDLERWLSGEPIQARPTGAVERARKWVRRRPAMAALIAVSAAAAIGLGALGWIDNRRLHLAWQAAEQNADEARHQRQEAETNAAEAVRQRDEANAGFRKRQDTVDALLIRFDGRLESLGRPLASVRLEFLNEFLKLNDELLKERGQEPGIRRQAAQLYQRIADLEAQHNGGRDAEPVYQKAIALYRELADQGSADEDDRTTLAYVHAQLAQLQRRARRYGPAQASYEEAIRLRERLIADFPDHPIHRYRTASYHFLLADLFDEQRKPKEAEALYRRALEEQEQLVKDYPKDISYREALFDTAGSLSVLLEPTRPDESQRLLERIAHGHWQAGLSNPGSLQSIIASGYDLAEFLQRHGRHADLARLATDITGEFSTSADLHYHATCFAARAVKALDADKALAPADRAKPADAYARQAVELLRRAVQLGWKDREHMFLDADLDPLRGRQDFRDLLADLDKRIGKPLTTEQLVGYLTERYQDEQARYQATLSQARTVAERKKAGAARPSPEDFVRRFLSLAEEHPKDPAAVTALAQVLLIAAQPPLARSDEGKRLRARAFEVLQRDHLQSPAFADICDALGDSPTPEGDRLLRTAFEKHALPEVRGQAGFWLARSLAKQAEEANDSSTGYAQLCRRAEEQFECVARDYGTLAHGTTTLGEAARTQLHALRHLAVGRPAEDIVGNDLDGRPMKLSDFRGRVVLLDFWANWCGFCRQMYPYEKSLTERLRDQPFAMVGVNCDSDGQDLRREIKRHGISWRSWWDEDHQISRRWQADSLPMMFLIDHRGVIRYRFSGATRGDVIDAAVGQLLKEARQAQAPR